MMDGFYTDYANDVAIVFDGHFAWAKVDEEWDMDCRISKIHMLRVNSYTIDRDVKEYILPLEFMIGKDKIDES